MQFVEDKKDPDEDYRTWYSGDPDTCDFKIAYYGASLSRDKYAAYIRTITGMFGSRINGDKPFYHSFRAAVTACERYARAAERPRNSFRAWRASL